MWHQDGITILKTIAVDEKRPLIPVLLDADVKVPTILDMAMVSRELAADGVAVGLRLAMVGTPVSDAPLCAGLTASRESWGRRLIFLSSLR